MNHIQVKNSSVLLVVDAVLELSRADLYCALLMKFGQKKKATSPFPYGTIQALDLMDRCYDNAMETALHYDLRYLEGIMIFDTVQGLFPLAHGWCEDKNGMIVDSTCHKKQGVLDVEYFGIRIKKEYSVEWKQRVGYYGCLDGDRQGREIGVHFEDEKIWRDCQ